LFNLGIFRNKTLGFLKIQSGTSVNSVLIQFYITRFKTQHVKQSGQN